MLLDCLGTLVALDPPAPRLREELKRGLGIDVGEAASSRAMRAEIDYYLAHHLEGVDRARLASLRDSCAGVLVDGLGLPPTAFDEVRRAMLASLSFSPYPDARPALEELRAAGTRLVVASNWDCSLAEVLERVGVLGLVDGVVSSAAVGAAKPDPALFAAALDVAACRPEAALFVGDSLERDVAGARAAGMAAVLVAREEASDPSDVPVVHSLEEVPSLI